MDQDVPLRLHFGTAFDQKFCSASLQQTRRCHLVADIVGYPEQAIGRDVPRRTISANRRSKSSDSVAYLPVADAVTNSFDDTRSLHAQSAGISRRIKSAAMIGIDKVEAYRKIAHPDLARCRFGKRHIGPLNNLWSAGALNLSKSFHHPATPDLNHAT